MGQDNYKKLSFSLYLNYVIHGFGLLILFQNMQVLSQTWKVSIAVVSYIISGVGIGRLLSYLLTGYFSDKVSRKFFVYLGMGCYFVFAIGIPFSRWIIFSYFLAILAGVANSALDAGTYTTFVEIAHGNGRYTVLIKAVASLGEFIIPLLVATFHKFNIWFGYSFMIMAALLGINMIILFPIKFPMSIKPSKTKVSDIKINISPIKRYIMSILFAFYGYLSMALMIWFTQWITLFGKNVKNFNNDQSRFLLSLYSVGSIIGVLILFFVLGKGIDEIKVMLVMNTIATFVLIIIIYSKNILVTELGSILFGFSAASGIMQTALTAFMKLYPTKRGLITGIFYFFGAIASFTVPLITGYLSEISIRLTFNMNFVVSLLAIIVDCTCGLLSWHKKHN